MILDKEVKILGLLPSGPDPVRTLLSKKSPADGNSTFKKVFSLPFSNFKNYLIWIAIHLH